MNKEQYLKRKVNKGSENQYRIECNQCLRPMRACFCHEITPVTTRVKIVILMHPTEMNKGHIGTGRLAHLSLPNSKIIIDKSFDANPEFNKIMANAKGPVYILYPSDAPLDLSSPKVQDHLKESDSLVFVIDATWPRAKAMMKNSKKLHDLPRISLNIKTESIFGIKQQPQSYCLSTIESIFHLIKELQTHNCECTGLELNNFLNPLKALVSFHETLAADKTQNNYKRTSSSPKPQAERTPSKKWETRNVFYNPKDSK